MLGRTLKKLFHRVKKTTKNIRFNKTKRHSRKHGSRRHSRKQFGGTNPFVTFFDKSAFIKARPDEYEESTQTITFENPVTKRNETYSVYENTLVEDGSENIILIKDKKGKEYVLKVSEIKKRSPSKSKSPPKNITRSESSSPPKSKSHSKRTRSKSI